MHQFNERDDRRNKRYELSSRVDGIDIRNVIPHQCQLYRDDSPDDAHKVQTVDRPLHPLLLIHSLQVFSPIIIGLGPLLSSSIGMFKHWRKSYWWAALECHQAKKLKYRPKDEYADVAKWDQVYGDVWSSWSGRLLSIGLLPEHGK